MILHVHQATTKVSVLRKNGWTPLCCTNIGLGYFFPVRPTNFCTASSNRPRWFPSNSFPIIIYQSTKHSTLYREFLSYLTNKRRTL